ncbi:hypothetical protein HDU92_001165 [Lobulomyces angularis]|nr:hypothetical protein HDU92_001165 [Lobulomyces angularis]
MLIKIFTIIIVLATLCQSNKIVTTSLEPIEITDDNYIPLLKNTSQVWLIKFYADWCGACRHFEHEFDEVIREKIKKDKVLKKYTLGKVNVDKAKIVAGTFLLTALPSVFLVDYSNSQVKKVNCRNFNCFKNYLDNIEKNNNFGKEDLVYIYPLGN